MTALALRYRVQSDDVASARGHGPSSATRPHNGRYSLQASIGNSNAGAGVTVSFSARSLASVVQLAHATAKLGSQGVQLVEDAAEATADLAGEVLENGTMAGVVGAALVSTLV